MPRRLFADTGSMRGVGLVVLLISLVLVGVLTMNQGKSQGPTSAAATQDEQLALSTAAQSLFSQVTQTLDGEYAQTGTYVGAQLPPGSGVVLAQATPTSYCLTANITGTVMHETGPGGSPVTGPC